MIAEKYWPTSNKGKVLITTRNRRVARQLAKKSVEVPELKPDVGVDFMLHLLSRKVTSEAERSKYRSLCESLQGHTLGLTQMAGVMGGRSWAIDKFIQFYRKQPHRYRQLDPDPEDKATHIGYPYSLSTVFDISFGGLSENSLQLLRVIALVSPENIPAEMFNVDEHIVLPPHLAFFQDEVL